ncbi:dihydrodipicolinate synthase family protein [Paenarthrobacter aurescens]|uniref:Dihydrodipicolinate synthase family protein n=1 Tax=Paenarthrobacter aurescens TaxID=43663 RepID=A0A4Y3NAR6_PAEAU|nr:dihydrodipicolinate synthase family protein [Paenarthrobacter aurescens]MDO6143399.1 dihydrodipicolinate synthase family protein [Paenarthrobacter aurescens]MDO6147247.1 dihydrodipicolinate synthase family protein [Paenarthrobacter aurescens]MDO6158491.1 dihydrodipicolinate synthase family protein [Paenarthrobacter aurescens]MDO6162474.1 dihydrodipicolinate synthase family protein [Paenarthrobacter aurescens]GEB18217.1 dihydrodipicolinate synthase family protein [Paenarthrobacter aurescens]
MFDGLSAFPLTPMDGESVDLKSLGKLVSRAAEAGADSLGVLGSTGNYAYLSREERRTVLETAVGAANGVPVLAGVGAVRTRDVLAHAGDAHSAGASALLLAPVSYQKLSDAEVFGLFETVASESDLPVVVYDNPGTTGFSFSDDLLARIARIPGVASIKIPPPPSGEVAARISKLKPGLPEQVSLGISGDWVAAEALLAGCNVWYSVIAGVLPRHARTLVDHAIAGRRDLALADSEALEPLWSLFRTYGSLRVTAALAEDLGVVPSSALPLPLRGLDSRGREKVAEAIGQCNLEA